MSSEKKGLLDDVTACEKAVMPFFMSTALVGHTGYDYFYTSDEVRAGKEGGI